MGTPTSHIRDNQYSRASDRNGAETLTGRDIGVRVSKEQLDEAVFFPRRLFACDGNPFIRGAAEKRIRRFLPLLTRSARWRSLASVLGVKAMVETSTVCKFGWKAPDSALKGVDGGTYRFADVRGDNGTLVISLKQHLPLCAGGYQPDRRAGQGAATVSIGVIGIMSNLGDPRDSIEAMNEFARKNGFTFPYVEDSTRRSRAATTRNARRIFSDLMPGENCNIAGGSMPPGASSCSNTRRSKGGWR